MRAFVSYLFICNQHWLVLHNLYCERSSCDRGRASERGWAMLEGRQKAFVPFLYHSVLPNILLTNLILCLAAKKTFGYRGNWNVFITMIV